MRCEVCGCSRFNIPNPPEATCVDCGKSYQGDISLETEICVDCYVKTDVAVTARIDERKYYIEGVGQLCSSCFQGYFA